MQNQRFFTIFHPNPICVKTQIKRLRDNEDFKPRAIQTRVFRKTAYPTFREYLEAEGLQKCLPGMPSMEHGLSVYFKYFTKEQEREFGVMAIELELVK